MRIGEDTAVSLANQPDHVVGGGQIMEHRIPGAASPPPSQGTFSETDMP